MDPSLEEFVHFPSAIPVACPREGLSPDGVKPPTRRPRPLASPNEPHPLSYKIESVQAKFLQGNKLLCTYTVESQFRSVEPCLSPGSVRCYLGHDVRPQPSVLSEHEGPRSVTEAYVPHPVHPHVITLTPRLICCCCAQGVLGYGGRLQLS